MVSDPSRACPGTEVLAEYLEGGLPPERRQRLEEHLAECGDCCASFANSALFLHDDEDDSAAVAPACGPPRDRQPRRRTGGARLLVAALAGIAFGGAMATGIATQRRIHEHRAEAPVRPFVPRLTGGFPWTPVAAQSAGEPRRGGVTRAAAPAVLTGELDTGIERSMRAAAAAPRSPRAASDLGAALLARAETSGHGDDVVASLEAIEGALALSPALPEALFNRALALEALHLPLTAQKAWRRYLEVDRSSAWANEARQRLAAIDAAPRPSSAALRAELAATASGGDLIHLAELVQRFRTPARQVVQEELLPGWGRAHLSGSESDGERQLAAARAVAAEWEAQTADATLRLAVEEVEGSDGFERTALARGYAAFGEAARHFAGYDVVATRRAAESALRHLAPTSVGARWARVLRLACLAYHGEDVEEEGLRIAAAAAEATDRSTQGRALWVVGLRRTIKGDLQGGLEADGEALAAYEEVEEADSVAWMRFLTGEAYAYLGTDGEGWRHFRAALAAAPSIVDRDRAFSVVLGSAMVALLEGRPRTAAALIDEVLAGPPLEAPNQAAQTYLWRCRTRLALGDRAGAEQDFQRAAFWAARMSAMDQRLWSGDLAEAEGLLAARPERAIVAFSRAIAGFRAGRRAAREPGTLLARGRAYLAAGQTAAADADFARGLELIAGRAGGPREAPAGGRFEGAQQLLRERIQLALAAGTPERAFAVAERGRAQAAGGTGGAAARSIPPLALASVRQALDADTLLLSYAVLRDRVVLWRVSQREATFHTLTFSPSKLDQLLAALRSDLAAGAWSDASRHTATQLYRGLLEPARLERNTIVVIADGKLHGLPFAALINPASGRFLVEERGVSVAPSATHYLDARDRWRRSRGTPPQSALVVGDPDVDRLLFPGLAPLPGARDESRRVAAVYPRRRLLMGSNATRAAFLREAGRRDVIHFAGHATLNRVEPERSSLALATGQGGGEAALSARDIAALDLGVTRTVVLSACDSGAAVATRGDAPLSLARAFFAAGAPTVVASLWPVSDRPTALLITELHRGLRAGRAPAVALREAQLALLNGRHQGLRSPAIWAAFETIGG